MVAVPKGRSSSNGILDNLVTTITISVCTENTERNSVPLILNHEYQETSEEAQLLKDLNLNHLNPDSQNS